MYRGTACLLRSSFILPGRCNSNAWLPAGVALWVGVGCGYCKLWKIELAMHMGIKGWSLWQNAHGCFEALGWDWFREAWLFMTVQVSTLEARGVEAGARRPLPADCPICFEEIVDEKAGNLPWRHWIWSQKIVLRVGKSSLINIAYVLI